MLTNVVEVGAQRPAVREVHARGRVRARRDRRVEAAARVVVVVPHAPRARVVVPSGDRRDGDDRLQAVDAGRRHAVGQRAVVGLADHRRAAVVPVGDHLLRRLIRSLVGEGAAVEPVDDRLLAGDVLRAAVIRAALRRVAGAEHLAQHVRVAARHEVVVVEQRPAVVDAVAVPVRHALPLVAAAHGGVVRARVDDRRHLDRGAGLLRPDDVGRDEVHLLVAVLVHARLRDEHALADGLRVVEDRRSLAVLADRDAGIRRAGGSGEPEDRERNRPEHDPPTKLPHYSLPLLVRANRRLSRVVVQNFLRRSTAVQARRVDSRQRCRRPASQPPVRRRIQSPEFMSLAYTRSRLSS